VHLHNNAIEGFMSVPRWDLAKFNFVSHEISTEMKSVGEVMALGRSFEEAIQKATRMLNIGAAGMYPAPMKFVKKDLQNEMKIPSPRRLFAIAEALSGEWSIDEISILTGIDRWFLQRIKRCADLRNLLFRTKAESLTADVLRDCKNAGFSDTSIAEIRDDAAEDVTRRRIELGVVPAVKQIDTLAGEFPAKTNYLYLSYNGNESDMTFEKNAERHVIVLGGGPYSIGSSVEFDWCCVQAVRELQKQGFTVTMINSNPETVSTDYDECDQLFFDELTLERVMDVVRLLNPVGVVVSMGGQIPNSLALKLAKEGVPILGTKPSDIDKAEDRHKFGQLMDELVLCGREVVHVIT
jgi:carbamoyl-phosphate synthase large subunit